jgi:hypothetical protein
MSAFHGRRFFLQADRSDGPRMTAAAGWRATAPLRQRRRSRSAPRICRCCSPRRSAASVAERSHPWRLYFTDAHPTGIGPQREPGMFSASAPMAGYPKAYNIGAPTRVLSSQRCLGGLRDLRSKWLKSTWRRSRNIKSALSEHHAVRRRLTDLRDTFVAVHKAAHGPSLPRQSSALSEGGVTLTCREISLRQARSRF